MIENDAVLKDQLEMPMGNGTPWKAAPISSSSGHPRLRAGRRNPRTLYLQMGDEPNDMTDLPIGFFIDTAVAALIGDGLTSPWHLNEIRLTAEDRDDEPRRGR